VNATGAADPGDGLAVGIVGCGRMGTRRAHVARACGHRVPAVLDADPRRAHRLADDVGAVAVHDLGDLAALGCQVTVVATSHAALASMASRCLEARQHVLLEKPGGVREAELMVVRETARRVGRACWVGYTLRHSAGVKLLAEAVTRGLIGTPTHLRAVYGHGGRSGMESEWRCNRAAGGGGELLDQGVHLLDLTEMLLGPIVDVQARLRTTHWAVDVEDNAFLLVSCVGNATAMLHASWTEWRNTFRVEVLGTEGSLHLEGLAGHYGSPRLFLRQRTAAGQAPSETPLPVADVDAFASEWRAFLGGCRFPENLSSLDRAISILRVVDHVYDHEPHQAVRT
jgi:predicted dehydrogenase